MTSLENKLLEELRLQSLRDLEEAEKILDNEGYLEHVAWLCEQSYEKVVKFVYAYFKLKIQNGNAKSVDKKIYEAQHFGSYKLMINMFREIMGSLRNSVDTKSPQIMESASSESEKEITNSFMQFMKNVNYPQKNKEFEKKCQSVEEDIKKSISNYNAFKNFINLANEQSVKKSISVLNFDNTIKETIDKLSNEPMFKDNKQGFQELVKQALSIAFEINSKMYGFVSNALVLAMWILPHASMPRYPMLDYNFDNLTIYRDKSTELKPFFRIIISEIKKLHAETTRFFEALEYYKNQGMIATTP